MFGILKQEHWWIRPSGVAAVVIGVVSIVGALILAPASMAAETRSAMANLAELDLADAPALGVSGFSGTYGTADTPDLAKSSDEDNGDFSDPDGVLDHVTINGTQIVATSWDAGSTQLTARANATGFELNYNDVDDFMTSGSVDSYARCLDRGGALAYARGDGSLTYLLGQGIPEGDPTTVDITGDQLNMPDVDSGTLTVTVTRVENAVNTATEVSAEAYLDVRIEGDLKDSSGATVFQGMLVDMKVGHVRVTCRPSVEPSSSSITTAASSSSASASSESPTTETPSSDSPSISPRSPSPTDDPSSATPTSASDSPSSETPNSVTPTGGTSNQTPSGSGSATTSASTSDSTSDGDSPATTDGTDGGVSVGPFLPTTGSGTIFTGLIVGLTLALVGVLLLNLAARRSRG